MPRKNRTAAESKALIEKYYRVSHEVSKLEFCRQEKISNSFFYRHLERHNAVAKLSTKAPLITAPKFIELAAKQKPKRQILIKLFGLKLFNLELEYV